MARLNVNPTRMELYKLKNKLITAKKGHKLLKDKQDELMRIFIEMIKNNKKYRIEVEKKLQNSMKSFILSRFKMDDISFMEAISYSKVSYNVELSERNVMGVSIPKLNVYDNSDENILPYSFYGSTEELDDACYELNNVMKNLILLSELEKSCQLMADEIEKTRRRVNALEYMTIPQLEETIKYIRLKLDENDRSSIIRLMKANIDK